MVEAIVPLQQVRVFAGHGRVGATMAANDTHGDGLAYRHCEQSVSHLAVVLLHDNLHL